MQPGEGSLPIGPTTKRLQYLMISRADKCVHKIFCVDAWWRASESEQADELNDLYHKFSA